MGRKIEIDLDDLKDIVWRNTYYAYKYYGSNYDDMTAAGTASNYIEMEILNRLGNEDK